MQALLIADKKLKCTNINVENNLNCMIEINGIKLIERLLKQLDLLSLERIIITIGNQNEILENLISSFGLNTNIDFISSCESLENGDVYSLYAARDYLCEMDTLIINTNLILDYEILSDVVKDNNENLVVIDKYKSWMTGKTAILNNENEIVGIENKYNLNSLTLKDSYKLVGLYKFSKTFFKKLCLPILEICSKLSCDTISIENLLGCMFESNDIAIGTYLIKNNYWYSINDIQDIDLASTLFSSDDNYVAEKMFGSWGGYWRYPQYLDYFYLVTPYYPTKPLVDEIKANFENLLYHYPSGMKVNSLLAAKEFDIKQDNIVVGNGAAELIKSIMSTIKGRTGFIKPTFEEYPNRLPEEEHIVFNVMSDDFSYSAEDIINYFYDKEIKNLIVVNPENPSGNYIEKKSMKKLLNWTKANNIKLIVDESFVDFVDEENPTLIKQGVLDEYSNLYVVKSISKSYGVPGLRLGILASSDRETISWMKKDVSIWNINSFAEFYMQISNKYHKDYERALKLFREERKSFQQDLSEIEDLRIIPSQANYIMVELLNGIDAEWLKCKMLKDEKIFIKTLEKKINNGKHYLRLAIRNHSDNTQFIYALKKVLSNR
ncbi:MAG: aminotransferase class I/II-fold pyridoxal phosphate-dependent enzyme [Lactobacillus sp.]|nr:aminotransferase class I/II-fold pyridoxal phosphate-dependent enzyme [Lactobacillus sp.]